MDSIGRPLAHGRLRALRPEAGWALPDQRVAARRVVGALVPRPAADVRRSLAQRLGGGGLCRSSRACRIGGLVGRAKGYVERTVFHADAVGLCAVCRASIARTLSGG